MHLKFVMCGDDACLICCQRPDWRLLLPQMTQFAFVGHFPCTLTDLLRVQKAQMTRGL